MLGSLIAFVGASTLNNSLTDFPTSGAKLILGFYLGILIIFSLAVYIYTSITYSKIAHKTKTSPRWPIWVPFLREYIVSKMAKMHWWPMLFLVPVLLSPLFLLISKLAFVVVFLIGILLFIPFFVFWIIWHWKIFERMNKPGWWALFVLIPYIGTIIFFVFLGIAAWNDKKYN